ncbi:hypothetical protein HIM_07550 [Hirsutella minnesotensis 3608]|uniref:Galactose oxidase n=1 Tax=Hirsutella minnesotensis 3608 TaxID=1043627 RepID=A0A0F7ZTE6_9HYPO|nr:hypothetical protein HIM_07550 [Hirsutella minnesotensis 3608]
MAVAQPQSRGRSRRAATLSLALSFVSASTVLGHGFPYVSTQLLMPSACYNQSTCRGRDTAFVLSPSGDGGAPQLLAFNITGELDSGLRPQVISSELPFLKNAVPTTAFGAVRTSNGTIVVHAGACDGNAADVWSYEPGQGKDQSPGWVKRTTTRIKSQRSRDASRSPFFLGGTLAFSPKLAPIMDQPTIYSYGGMCISPETSPSDWQSAANYSKAMVSLTPQSQLPSTGYSIGVASVLGPRIPFAGFTLTQLSASVTSISGSVSQQASFVFLGGHTQKAYINISTAAVWNLPEESWSYVNIQSAEAQDGDSLPGVEMDSRSGHTAVLSEDGRSMVVLGGWVGNVSIPAQPQLAVLEMNQTYSSWRWKIPDEQPEGNGIYGHGAAMLPGNVMMVYGGWETQSGSGKAKRQEAASIPRFLNLTSMAWLTSYQNPNIGLRDNTRDAPDAESNSSFDKRLGLGIGLGLGVAALLGLIFSVCMWQRRKRKQKQVRDEAIRIMAEDAKHFIDSDMAERDEFFYWGRNWRVDGPTAPQRQKYLAYESLRGGASPQDITVMDAGAVTRKPLPRGQRAGYLPAESRFSAFVSPPGIIHPILEDDEEDGSLHKRQNQFAQQHMPLTIEPVTPTSEAHSDPFATPTGATATAPPILFPPSIAAGRATPEEPRRHDPDVQDWVSGVDAGDGLLARYSNRQGRISPTRRNSVRSNGVWDEESRTGSNLSESNRSATESLRRALSGKRPTLSFHKSSTAYGGAAAVLAGAGASSASPEQVKPGSSSSSSYNTARSGFAPLQAEAPALLMGDGGRSTPNSPGYIEEQEEEDSSLREPGSPSKMKGPRPSRRGWLGSLRRVFSTSSSSSPVASSLMTSSEESPRRASFDKMGSDYESHIVGMNGELLRRKQGRRDWEKEDGVGASSAAADEEAQQHDREWDIERAAEQRLVQVMFTVPRERLRVVNGNDADQQDDDVDTFAEERKQHQPQVAELVDPDQSSPDSSTTMHSAASSPEPPPEVPESPGRVQTDERQQLLAPPAEIEPRQPHSTDGSERPVSGTLHTAEAVTLSRPSRTRVLQMVDTIESQSRDESPASSRELV